jgi:uncharacterized protein RhaS with RHS repeats
MDYMVARYYSSSLGRFMAVDPGGDTELENPQTWNKYTYVRNNPLIAIDPDGRDTYLVNRQLAIFGAGATSRSNAVSHTFVVTTDAQGNVEHTYSWGNDPDEKNKDVEGKWFKDESEDVDAAKDALKDGKAEKVGGDDLDPFVDEAFDERADKKDDPSNHRNGIVCNNCKSEANKLVNDAKKKKEEADKKKQGGDKKKTTPPPPKQEKKK